MQRFLEYILGLEKGFLEKQGEFALQFNPQWPFQDTVGAMTWNLLLGAAMVALVVYVYRREARSRTARITLGTVRLLLLAFILAMLNRPVVTLAQSRTEPSVLAVLMDDSVSMKVRDGGEGVDRQGMTRLGAMLDLLQGQDQQLIKDLSSQHNLKFYRFDRDAQSLATLAQGSVTAVVAGQDQGDKVIPIAAVLSSLEAQGQSTQVLASLRTVLEELQGQRLAGVVILTDGRATPAESLADNLSAIKDFGIRVYPVAVGSEKAPQNITVESIDMQDAAFVRDIVSAKVHLRAIGYPANHQVQLALKDKATGLPLVRADGKPAEMVVTVNGEASQEVEVVFKPAEPGNLQVVAEAVKQAGEVDDQDNTYTAQIAVMDAKIRVLYVDGYPRWEYRYIKDQMIRDTTVDISCLLLSADTGFAQEGDPPTKDFHGPITRFPESPAELMAYDVVLFGDVDPRQFTDAQLQLVHDFVLKRNGGFGMIAGQRWSPYEFRNTAIEPVLPVLIARDPPGVLEKIEAGWRPVLTKDGANSTIFRFFEDKQLNDKFLAEDMQPLFWYYTGVSVKPGVGEVYAEHPTDIGDDGRKRPVLVFGRFGGGRTLFSAIDDSWRWRFYTGESIFDTYWIQQIRYLARAKKLGQRRMTFVSLRPSYERGNQVQLQLRVLDPELLGQLPEQLGVTVLQQGSDGALQPVRQETLERRQDEADLYLASWTADRVGRFVARIPAIDGAELPIVVHEPRVELLSPMVDRALLSKLVVKAESGGQDDVAYDRLVVFDRDSAAAARAELRKIPSAAMVVPIYTHELLWNAPLAMLLFVLLITTEWVIRKLYGML